MPKHVAVWLDHKEARIFTIAPTGIRESLVRAPAHDIHNRHPRGPEETKEHPNDAKRFFGEVARSLEGVDEILVVGPSTAKLEFLRYAHGHDRGLEARIVGVETVDHPTDGQLIAYAKTYFERVDRKLP